MKWYRVTFPRDLILRAMSKAPIPGWHVDKRGRAWCKAKSPLWVYAAMAALGRPIS